MKLYMFQCGTIKVPRHLLIDGAGAELIEVPVPFFLIMHPEGNVLFDTGQPFSAITAKAKGNYIPIMTEADYISNQLRNIGLEEMDVTHIVLSHLHADHAGGIAAFTNAICYIQEYELQHENGSDIINQHPLQWCLLEGHKYGDYDIFGDEKLKIIFTPGHTSGHQSLLVTLQEWGAAMLTADSIYMGEILNENTLPGVFYNRQNTEKSIAKIRHMRDSGTRIIPGHDPKVWGNMKLSPAYYV